MIAYIVLAVVVLGVAGLITFLLLKQKKKKEEYNEQFTYTTKHGLRVKLSEKTADIPITDFEDWTEDVVNFWFGAKGWDRNKSLAQIKKISIFMYDQEYLNRAGIKVNGITWPSKFEIELATLPKGWSDDPTATYTPYMKVKSLFRHEVSHIIAGWVGGIVFDNEIHHKLFADVKLGA